MNSTTLTHDEQTDLGPNDGAVRGALVAGLLIIALVHVIDGIGKWKDGPRYEFWLYMGLVAGSLGLSGALLFTRSKLVLLGVLGLVGPAAIAFILSRTTGLPQSTDDIGNWTEPIGVINLFIEAVVLAIAGTAEVMRRRVSVARVPQGSVDRQVAPAR